MGASGREHTAETTESSQEIHRRCWENVPRLRIVPLLCVWREAGPGRKEQVSSLEEAGEYGRGDVVQGQEE